MSCRCRGLKVGVVAAVLLLLCLHAVLFGHNIGVVLFPREPSECLSCSVDALRGDLVGSERPQWSRMNVRRFLVSAVSSSGSPRSCRQTSVSSDVRSCLGDLMPRCRQVTHCAIAEGYAEKVVAPTHVTAALANDSSDDTAGSDGGPSPPWSPELPAARVSFSFPLKDDGLLQRKMLQRIGDKRHSRLHYNCSMRDRVRQWNVTCRVLSAMCLEWNTTTEAVRDDEAVAARMVVDALNASAIETLKTVAAEQRVLASSTCATWMTLVAQWRSDALRRNVSLWIQSSESVLSAEEIAAVRWADALRPTPASHDTFPAPWAHDVFLTSWMSERDEAIARINATAVSREAYHRWRQKLKDKHDAEREARKALNVTLPPASVPEPSMTDMLFADPMEHEGCTSRRVLEVRIAFVGDSITMAYPKRLVTWLRVLCSHCISTPVKIHVYNFAVSGKQVVDIPRGFRQTVMYNKSILYEPDVVVLMLGTNDGAHYWYLNESFFEESLRDMLQRYADLPSSPTVLVLTPPPAFDEILANYTRPGSRKRRPKTYERRVGYGCGERCRMIGERIVPSIKRVVQNLRTTTQVRLVDFNQRVLEWLLHNAAKWAATESVNQSAELPVQLLTPKAQLLKHGLVKNMRRANEKELALARSLHVAKGSVEPTATAATAKSLQDAVETNDTVALDALPSSSAEATSVFTQQWVRWDRELSEVLPQTLDTQAPYLYGLPLATTAVQRAIFNGITDAVHLEKGLQKVAAVEVLRQLMLSPEELAHAEQEQISAFYTTP